MEITSLMFIIEAENYFNALTRVLQVFNRRRIEISKIRSFTSEKENTQLFMISVNESLDNARKISMVLNRQVDVLTANYFEQPDK